MLFFLFVNSVLLGDRVVFLGLVFLGRILLRFIIVASVVGMAFANALSVSNRNQFDE